MGFWNIPTQEAIHDLHVGIGGTGGAGYLVALELARIGVRYFTIADPEDFEQVNGNRVLGVNQHTIGLNKAKVLEGELRAVNPRIRVRTFTDGITPENLDDFMKDVHAVLDATELSMPELGTMIARKARTHNIPVVSAEYVAHAGQVTVFSPSSKHTFERHMGIVGGERASLEDVAGQTLSPSRYLAYVPPYCDLKTLRAVQEGSSLPSNMIGAGVAAQLAVAEFLKLARERAGEKGMRPTYAPHMRWYDAYTGKGGRTRLPRVTHYKHLLTMVANNLLGRHERASYTLEERAARGDID